MFEPHCSLISPCDEPIGATYAIPDGTLGNYIDDIRVVFVNGGRSDHDWTGSFKIQGISTKAVSASHRFSGSETSLVVADGMIYIGNNGDPASWAEHDSLTPIIGMCVHPVSGCVIVHDFTRVAAFGPDGEIWKSDRVSWDGIQKIECMREEIRGVGWDAPANCEVNFRLDADDGTPIHNPVTPATS